MAEILRLTPPLKDYPLTENDRITLSWSRFLDALALAAGGGIVPVMESVVIRLVGGKFLGAYDSVTGELLGLIPLENQPGGAVQPVVIIASPQVYTAASDGTLVVFAGMVELSRDQGVTWYKVTLQGGAVPMKNEDRVRVTWYSADPPEITWFPDYST